jgi:leader peptidase (prepilin peptidase) / N-methyltransferase
MSSLVAHLALRPLELPAVEIALVVIWMMFVGGCIGSFLNVVVYRIPIGLSIVRPGSHCPRCKTPIRARHNLPVIGWLVLRGKCRDCRLPISPRYPLVELYFGLVLLLLAFCEPLTHGAALPLERAGILRDVYPYWGILAYHFFLIAGLGAAGLMQFDRAIVPARYWRFVLLAALVPPVIWPVLRPLPMSPFDFVAAGRYVALVEGLAEGLVGASVGTVLGVAAWPAATIGIPRRSGHLSSIAAAALVGVGLGWQAAVGILTFATVIFTVDQALRPRDGVRVPWLLIVALALTAWIPFWRTLVSRVSISLGSDPVDLLSRQAPWYVPAAAAVVIFALSLLSRTFAGDKQS